MIVTLSHPETGFGRIDRGFVAVGPEDEERALQILRQYRGKDFSFTNATSFAVMERLGIAQAVSFDRHFQQYG